MQNKSSEKTLKLSPHFLSFLAWKRESDAVLSEASFLAEQKTYFVSYADYVSGSSVANATALGYSQSVWYMKM